MQPDSQQVENSASRAIGLKWSCLHQHGLCLAVRIATGDQHCRRRQGAEPAILICVEQKSCSWLLPMGCHDSVARHDTLYL